MNRAMRHHPSTMGLPPEHLPTEPDQSAILELAELPELGAGVDPSMPVRITHPVIVWNDVPRVLTTAQQNVADVGGRLLNTNAARKDAAVRNLGATTVYVAGEQQSCTPGQGWPILPGEVLVLEVVHEVWACSSGPGVTGQVATMQQLRDGG